MGNGKMRHAGSLEHGLNRKDHRALKRYEDAQRIGATVLGGRGQEERA